MESRKKKQKIWDLVKNSNMYVFGDTEGETREY